MQQIVDKAVSAVDKLIADGKVPKPADYIVDGVKYSPTPHPDGSHIAGTNKDTGDTALNRGLITIYPAGAKSLSEAIITYAHELGHFNRNWTAHEQMLDRYGKAVLRVYQGGNYGDGPRP